MNYYQVVVAHSFGQKESKSLTYHYDGELRPGQLCIVPFGKKTKLAMVDIKTTRPSFKTKVVSNVLPLNPLPMTHYELVRWIASHYAVSEAKVLSAMLPRRLTQRTANSYIESQAMSSPPTTVKKLPTLTKQQVRVVDAISNSSKKLHLLHGETGSGKTRIYIELAKQALARGEHALILVPEISLTTQIIDHLGKAFGHDVILYHSGLSEVERRSIWLKALQERSSPRIWLGTRSAIFLPLYPLGIVAIDESHDPSYKQNNAPRYHATAVLAQVAKLSRDSFRLVLGSATPLVRDMYVAREKKIPVHRLSSPVKPQSSPDISVVDLKNKDAFSSHQWVSTSMLEQLRKTLDNKEQAIIFLNRRGSAPMILCRNCGWQALCPNCDLPQTYHGDSHERRCHICNKAQEMLNACPDCYEPDLLLRGCGTKEIEQALKNLLPEARILRFDRDNVQQKDYLDAYRKMQSGEVDIIIGTQMIAKGFDLQNVTMVGVVHADAGLSMPDFSAGERTFQLLYQVMGRGGRHRQRNVVVIQTYRPDHPVIRSALSRNWNQFYKTELDTRRTLGFPPHSFVLKIRCRDKSSAAAESTLEKLAKNMPQSKNIRVLGPSPAFHVRSGSLYMWDLVVLSKNRATLSKIASLLPASCIADLDPLDIL